MLCEKCHKQQASTFATQNVNGVLEENYLCASCAQNQPKEKSFETEKTQATCICGTTFEEIATSGYVGCTTCYQTFLQELKPVIVALHGHETHKGKRPQTPKERLEQQIEKAIANNFLDLAKKLQKQLDDLMRGEK